MKRTSSETAGWRAGGASVVAHHSPGACSPLPLDVHHASGRQVLADREADRERDTADALHFLERGGIALEDPLLRLRNRQIPQYGGDLTVGVARRRAQHPLLFAQQRGGRRVRRERAVGRGDGEDLVLQEGPHDDRPVGRAVVGTGAECDVDGARTDQLAESARGVDGQFHGKIVGPRGEQLDQPRRGVLRERAGGRDAQQPPAVRRLGHLDRRLLLQAQDFHRPAREPQAAGREREAGGGLGEQRVVEFLAQLRNVHRDARVRHAEFRRRRAHRAQPHHGRKGPKLSRCHELSLRWVACVRC